MSDKQHFENPPVEEIDHPTSQERSEAPNNGSKPKHTSSITTNNSGKKKPSSHHPHQQVQKKQESEDTPVTADPQPAFRRRRQSGTIKITAATSNDEEASKPAPQVKPEKAVTASRHGSTTPKTKREKDQAPQELQESISKSPPQADSQHAKQISLPDSIEPIADTPAVEPEPQALPGKIETVAVPDESAQEVISPDVAPDNTSPSTKVDSPSVDVEPTASTRQLEVDQTSPKIKAATTPLSEPEVALAESKPAISQQREPRRVPGKALVWILMAVLIGSSFLLWRDLNDT